MVDAPVTKEVPYNPLPVYPFIIAQSFHASRSRRMSLKRQWKSRWPAAEQAQWKSW